MVKKVNASLLNKGRMPIIKGVVIHNDAGSMTPESYINWLKNRNLALGIAHYYINRDCIARVVDTNKIAWHTGNRVGNSYYIGFEVCESKKVSDTDFLANEDMTLMQATEDLLFYKLPINHDTVKLHHEFTNTTCPHRSMALHGNTTASVKQYFIDRMTYFASLGKTVEEMIANKNKATSPQAQQQEERVAKSIEEVAKEVINGQWGNGATRVQNLSNAGYNAIQVQEKVDELLGKSQTKVQQTQWWVHLPNHINSWNVYRLNGPYTIGNEVGKLAPARFGGLNYHIERWIIPNQVAQITTQNFGKVAIYIASGTSARCYEKTI